VALCRRNFSAVPFKKTAKAAIGYLEKTEMDTLLNQPDRCTSLGARDYALLLFLYNSGARADEAAKLLIGNLHLGASASVRLHGREISFEPVHCGRRRRRRCPNLWRIETVPTQSIWGGPISL
jgi:integrase